MKQGSTPRDRSTIPQLKARANALVTPMARNVVSRIGAMRGVLGAAANAADFEKLERAALALLDRIELLIGEGEIEPQARFRHSAESAHPAPIGRELRIGVFPIAANPIHWALLLGGLLAVERLHLDKVIYPIAGTDPRKASLAPEAVRHSMAREVLEPFQPLFEYSSTALGTPIPGEEILFKILRMNPGQAIHAFSIAGDSHFRRFHPATGRPDTIQKLEDGMRGHPFGFDGQIHRVSAVFLARSNVDRNVPTLLDVHHLRGLPLIAASTEVRRALERSDRRWMLYALPYAALVSILRNRLYGVESLPVPLQEHRAQVAP